MSKADAESLETWRISGKFQSEFEKCGIYPAGYIGNTPELLVILVRKSNKYKLLMEVNQCGVSPACFLENTPELENRRLTLIDDFAGEIPHLSTFGRSSL